MALHLSIESFILGSVHSFNSFFFVMGQSNWLIAPKKKKKKKVGLVKHPQLINMIMTNVNTSFHTFRWHPNDLILRGLPRLQKKKRPVWTRGKTHKYEHKMDWLATATKLFCCCRSASIYLSSPFWCLSPSPESQTTSNPGLLDGTLMRDPRISLSKTVDIFIIETVAFLFFFSLFWGGWVGGGGVSPHSHRHRVGRKRWLGFVEQEVLGRSLQQLSLRSSWKKAFRTGSCGAAQKSVL